MSGAKGSVVGGWGGSYIDPLQGQGKLRLKEARSECSRERGAQSWRFRAGEKGCWGSVRPSLPHTDPFYRWKN